MSVLVGNLVYQTHPLADDGAAGIMPGIVQALRDQVFRKPRDLRKHTVSMSTMAGVP